MKGIVFTEFLNMVESEMGYEMVDRIILASGVANQGAYTSVGSYDHTELIKLVSALGQATNQPPAALLRHFGFHLFNFFRVNFPQFFEGVHNCFDFLLSVDQIIHQEVMKLYPDAELPAFDFDDSEPGYLAITYQSSRNLGDLAEGLILASIEHFNEELDFKSEKLTATNGLYQTKFELRRHHNDGR
jgi:hypothetical protein